MRGYGRSRSYQMDFLINLFPLFCNLLRCDFNEFFNIFNKKSIKKKEIDKKEKKTWLV
jgi:hypothetical protein